MAQVQITERIYVNARGRRVDADYKGPKSLAAVPGDVLSEERAAELGVKRPEPKAQERADDKSRERADDKSRQAPNK